MSKHYYYHKDHGHDIDDCGNLNIGIEKLIQRRRLMEYVHKETHSVNRRFNRGRSESPDVPPNIRGRVNVISGGVAGEEITLVILNFKVGRMLEDTGNSIDILFLDAYLKLGMSRAQIHPVATPLDGFTGDIVSPLGVANLMVNMGKYP
ncbi:hypothetical protein LIER_35248 [Lithospermum erythrorhizon]|uniref:Uncharacterized protein n=1 Tax=Lithospermum erythrorhizon TaxID=34254 RepID=A0AAV3NNU9_LITER